MKKNKNIKDNKESSVEGIILTGIVCFLIPFMHLQVSLDPVLFPRFAAWSGASILLSVVGYMVYRKQKYIQINLKNPIVILLTLYAGWSAIALIWAGNPVEGLTDVFKWLTLLLFTIITSVLISRNAWNFDVLVKGVVTYSLFTSAYGFMQFFEFVPMQPDVNAVYEVKGFMAHKNQLSIALFLFFPFLYYAWSKFSSGWKKAALAGALADVILILLLGTRAVWLAIIVSGLCFILFIILIQDRSDNEIPYRKWINRVLVVAGILALLFVLSFLLLPEGFILNRISNRFISILDPDFTSNKWRTEMWMATFDLFKDNPLFGVGTGNWKIDVYPYYSEYQPSVFRHWRNPHNDYLLAATEKGIIGLIFFTAIYITPSISALVLAKRNKSSSEKRILLMISVIILGYMFVSFFSFPGERIHHHVFLGVLFAFLLARQFKERNKYQVIVPGIFLFWVPLVFLLPVFYFSIRTVKAEIELKKAFAAQEEEQWSAMNRSVEKADFRWAPLEPRRTCPIQFYKGYALYKRHSYAEAKRIFLRSYELHPNNQLITNNLGSVYGQLAKFDSAAFFFNRSIELLPRYELGLINLSKVYYLRDDNEKAYQTILACDPKSKNQEIGQISNMLKKRLNQ